MTEAERKDGRNYAAGDVIRFYQNVRGGFRSGETLTVVGHDEQGRVLAKRQRGQPLVVPLEQARHFDVYERRELKLASGDRIRITRNGMTADGAGRLLNGSLQTVAGFDRYGNIVLMNGQVVAKDFGHLAHGYCTTSHAAQGKTVDRVLVALGPESFAAASKEQFYVSVSRGKESVTVYCQDKRELLDAVGASRERLSATELARKGEESQRSPSRVVRLAEHIRRVTRWDKLKRLAERRDNTRPGGKVRENENDRGHGR
jgi:hypothetical protein